MVARRRLLKTGPKRKPVSTLDRHARVPLGHAEIEKESRLENSVTHASEEQSKEELEEGEVLNREPSAQTDDSPPMSRSTSFADGTEAGDEEQSMADKAEAEKLAEESETPQLRRTMTS